eukprot:Pompholyxophrys_punicea_v1_NODE_710_length_1410_cov_10.714391.p2 type:complete len:106 gc:universal NODE_710_length_1410_cov_10.714391:1224-907(-)
MSHCLGTKNLTRFMIKARKDKIMNLITNTRRDYGAGDTFRVLETDGYARLKDDRLFLNFNFIYVDKDDDKLKRMLVWIHPTLKKLRKYANPAFLDGTFKCVPKPS